MWTAWFFLHEGARQGRRDFAVPMELRYNLSDNGWKLVKLVKLAETSELEVAFNSMGRKSVSSHFPDSRDDLF